MGEAIVLGETIRNFTKWCNVSTKVIPFISASPILMALFENQTWTQTLDLRKNGPVGKIGPQGLKSFTFVSSHINVEVIYFHLKSIGVESLVLWKERLKSVPQIYIFWKRRNRYKKDNCQFLVLISMERFRMIIHFYKVLMRLAKYFISSTGPIFIKL